MAYPNREYDALISSEAIEFIEKISHSAGLVTVYDARLSVIHLFDITMDLR